MLLVIDNYDSFTFNLVQAFGALGERPRVVRNDEATPAELERLNPDRIVISPGPSTPERAGISNDAIRAFLGRRPILGVCLGHQCLAHALGGAVVRAAAPRHGKTSLIRHDEKTIFKRIPSPFVAMRYHSLVVDESRLPADLEVSARSESGEIMGLRHRRFAAEGVQFHPESYRTPEGLRLLARFLELG